MFNCGINIDEDLSKICQKWLPSNVSISINNILIGIVIHKHDFVWKYVGISVSSDAFFNYHLLCWSGNSLLSSHHETQETDKSNILLSLPALFPWRNFTCVTSSYFGIGYKLVCLFLIKLFFLFQQCENQCWHAQRLCIKTFHN